MQVSFGCQSKTLSSQDFESTYTAAEAGLEGVLSVRSGFLSRYGYL